MINRPNKYVEEQNYVFWFEGQSLVYYLKMIFESKSL